MAARGRPTLREVAERAGVSARTVSNVVNSGVPVRPETRARVEQVIAELGYRPNLAARRLRSGRSHTVGLALPGLTVPYFREFTDSMLAAAHRHGMSLLVAQTGGDADRERSVARDPYFRHVDGIVLAAVSLGHDDVPALSGPVPVLVAATSFRPAGVDTVDTDAAGAARAVVEHLYDGGRRAIAAVVPGDAGRPTEQDERYRGYVAALHAAGLTVDPRRVVGAGAVTPSSGARAVRTLLDRAPETDAVFALGDALGLGVLRGLRDAGRTVPDDVAVVGFGDVPESAHSNPTLSSVDPGQQEIAGRSVALIAGGLAGPPGAAGRAVLRETVGFRLVVRESSRAPGA
ncbi:LacI family DNA-binding transcriptional regulator [Pseudonocardia sp. HH130630-07]|uniref:LacI family DNA-binding transcriptional regulator n=1 Tax=Pseudonocardia sp. HH130630-07 TaxID=1690815 RepID=UPI0008151689|nr:LacI family DNA-binding transcriptional regulator [Pseudonocardia sp. HH130630-07]ANY09551.1 hypothetical protein AFB00_28640 [Pseudonocardia sp. HH130630-07]